MTGFVDAHTHLYAGLVPYGLPNPEPPPQNFVEILERVWWRLDRALDAAMLAAAARAYLLQARRSGTIGLIDHHESPEFIEGSLDVIADACQALGMPAVLAYGVTERNGGRAEARRGLAECARFLASNDRPLVRAAVGVHAGFTVSDETLVEAASLAREHGTVLHLHVAEDRVDVEDARRRGDDGVVARLLRLDALPEGSILAHGVHADEREVDRAAERGAWFVQNPRSNRANGVGYPRALRRAPRVALGTDGFPSDGAEERRALEEDAARAGEKPGVAVARAAAGLVLLRERFGGDLPAPPPLSALDVDEVAIEEEALRQAERLQERLARLTGR